MDARPRRNVARVKDHAQTLRLARDEVDKVTMRFDRT